MPDQTDGATSAAPAAESAAPAPSAPTPTAPASAPVETPTSSGEEATTAPASEPDAPATPTGGDGAPPDESASAPDSDAALSPTDPADPPSSDESASAEAYSAYLALEPHEQARLDGVPEEFIREGHYWFDERDGHGKFKDRESFVRARKLNDEYASGFKTREGEYEEKVQTLTEQYESAQAAQARSDAMLAAILDLDPEGKGIDAREASLAFFAEKHLPDHLKNVDPEDITAAKDLRSHAEAMVLARQERDAYFDKVEADAAAQVERQKDFAKRSAEYVAESLTPKAFGADSHDLQAAMGSVLSKPSAHVDGYTTAQLIGELGALDPDVAELAVIGAKVKTYLAAGVPLPYGEAPPKKGGQQEKTKESGGSAAPASHETNQAAPSDPSAPTEPERAHRPVTETSIETSAALPAQPAGAESREERDGRKTTARALQKLRRRGR